VLAAAPDDAPEVPARVAELAGGATVHAVWRNEVGGLTFRLGDGAGRRFVKWQPAGRGVDLAGEAERLAWAVRFTPVPAVLGRGDDAHGSWLLTAGLPGENAVGPRWRADPGPAVAAIGHGLRAWHDALPVSGCPFWWAPEDGRPAPPVAERDLVVCHGDACAPNTLVDERGRWVGHVDVGALGVGDRWADLAIATWSTAWNYGPGWEEPLLAAYGVAPDPARIRRYRDLWGSAPSG
jgi:kanamycin kinase